jgi:anhydro-N-acetylmuramic acid kinase
MPALFVGIMSGTSLDGIDIALTSIEAPRNIRLLGARCVPFPLELRNALLNLCQPGHDEVRRSALAGQDWARLAADGVNALLEELGVTAGQITAIGSHGQTIRHHPEQGFSVQIGAPSLLAEMTGVTVVADFRSRDLAAGGEGAPLVPAFHHWLLSHPDVHRVLVNIGGFANLTLLRPNEPVTGFDSGPGNVLMDEWITRHLGLPYDQEGRWAGEGKVDDALLSAMLADPYFRRGAPKSTGREYFNATWLGQQLESQPRPPAPVDVQATLLELTARSIAEAARATAHGCDELYICGGGAHNRVLMSRLQSLLEPLPVSSTQALGVDPDWMEAMAFAWLAWRRLTDQPGNLPAVTGARGERVLGAVYSA